VEAVFSPGFVAAEPAFVVGRQAHPVDHQTDGRHVEIAFAGGPGVNSGHLLEEQACVERKRRGFKLGGERSSHATTALSGVPSGAASGRVRASASSLEGSAMGRSASLRPRDVAGRALFEENERFKEILTLLKVRYGERHVEAGSWRHRPKEWEGEA